VQMCKCMHCGNDQILGSNDRRTRSFLLEVMTLMPLGLQINDEMTACHNLTIVVV
jgi:cytochrome c-type biogenesis protein CcmH/NrfF